jgi:hypothetical protein
LICSESRAITVEALGGSSGGDSSSSGSGGGAIPIRLLNWVRLWNVRGPNTYLGVQQCVDANANVDFDIEPTSGTTADATTTSRSISSSSRRPPISCVGVLFPLPSSKESENALEALDRREFAYTRQKVDLGSIERVDDLLIEEESSNANIITSTSDIRGIDKQKKLMEAIQNKYYKDTFLGKWPPSVDDANDHENEVCVWCYVPQKEFMGIARAENPILQSYVDVCVKGCLSISKSFAKEFTEGTYGWYPGHSPPRWESNAENDEEARAVDFSFSCWIDDRNNPKYVRADKEYSLENCKALDAVFDPVMLKRRR